MNKHVFQAALIALFLGFYLSSTAQENFIPGTITNNNGDRLSGFIDYRNWDKNPDKIAFKETEISEIIYYRPLEIKNFKVADEIYISEIVQVEKSPTNKLNHNRSYNVHFNDPNFILEIDTVFLQALFQGEKSLYYLKDIEAKSHFYIFYEKSYKLLLYKTYVYTPQKTNDIRSDLMSSAIKTKNKFKGQLTVYLENCPSIAGEISKSKYDRNSLSNLFEKYYTSCSDSDLSFIKEKDKTKFEFGALAGATFTKIGFSGTTPNATYKALIDSDFPLSTNPTFGMFLNIRFSRNFGKLSMNNELLFTSYSVSETYSDYHNPEYYSNNKISLGFKHLKLNMMFRYRFELNKSTFFVNGGYSLGNTLVYTNQVRKETVFYSTERIEIVEAIPAYDLDQGLLFGFGSQIKRFGLEARFEHSFNGIAAVTGIGSSLNRVYVLLSYRFRD